MFAPDIFNKRHHPVPPVSQDGFAPLGAAEEGPSPPPRVLEARPAAASGRAAGRSAPGHGAEAREHGEIMGISWGYKYEINDFDKYDMDVQIEMFVVFFGDLGIYLYPQVESHG